MANFLSSNEGRRSNEGELTTTNVCAAYEFSTAPYKSLKIGFKTAIGLHVKVL